MCHRLGMRAILAALVMAVTGCGSDVSTKVLLSPLVPDVEDAVIPHTTIHADEDFSPDERSIIVDAARVWFLQTGGVANIKVVFDLDFKSVSNIAEHVTSSHNTMVRYGSWMNVVHEVDEAGGSTVLGWVSPSGGLHNPWHVPYSVGFVVDRFQGRQYALQVIIHEMGHVLGLPHSGASNDIMYPSILKTRTSCLKSGDLAKFCDVNVCGNTKTYPCE